MSAENLIWKNYDENKIAKKLRKDAGQVVNVVNLNDLRCLSMNVSSDMYGALLEMLKDNPQARDLVNAIDHLQFIHHCGDTASLSEIDEAKEMIVKFYSGNKSA